jgi:hypothetical protein
MKTRKCALRRHHAERIRRKLARRYFVYRGMFDSRLHTTPERLAKHLKWCEEYRRYWQGAEFSCALYAPAASGMPPSRLESGAVAPINSIA